jgi:hypothetical protein
MRSGPAPRSAQPRSQTRSAVTFFNISRNCCRLIRIMSSLTFNKLLFIITKFTGWQ